MKNNNVLQSGKFHEHKVRQKLSIKLTNTVDSLGHGAKIKLNYHIDDIPKSIRPAAFSGRGCVLLARPNEKNHEFYQAVIFVFQHLAGKASYGVLVNQPTPYEVSDSIPQCEGVFRQNRLFNGGNDGSNLGLVLHNQPLTEAKKVGYGIYLGDLATLINMESENPSISKDVKFFMNGIFWGPDQLQREISEENRWDVCHLPVDIILDQDIVKLSENPGALWHTIRSALSVYPNYLKDP